MNLHQFIPVKIERLAEQSIENIWKWSKTFVRQTFRFTRIDFTFCSLENCSLKALIFESIIKYYSTQREKLLWFFQRCVGFLFHFYTIEKLSNHSSPTRTGGSSDNMRIVFWFQTIKQHPWNHLKGTCLNLQDSLLNIPTLSTNIVLKKKKQFLLKNVYSSTYS